MPASVARAHAMSRTGSADAAHAISLADVFCRGSRRKVDQLFAELWGNHDVEAYRTAIDVLEGEHVWMERLVDNLYAAGKKLLEKAEALFPGILDSKGGETTRPEDRPVTTPTVKGDVVSDPALDDTTGSDWTDEGGAAPEGPATNTRPKP